VNQKQTETSEKFIPMNISLFILKIDNLVFWANSEVVGYAVKRADKNTELRRQNSE